MLSYLKVFLIAYAGLILIHSLTLDWSIWQAPTALSFGLILALCAHTRFSHLTIVLLLTHMSIEWVEHGRHYVFYSNREITLHGIHAILDFIFLYHELRLYTARFYRQILVIGCMLYGITLLCRLQPLPKNPHLVAMIHRVHRANHHTHRTGPLEALVIGGMIGCVMAHIKKPIT